MHDSVPGGVMGVPLKASHSNRSPAHTTRVHRFRRSRESSATLLRLAIFPNDAGMLLVLPIPRFYSIAHFILGSDIYVLWDVDRMKSMISLACFKATEVAIRNVIKAIMPTSVPSEASPLVNWIGLLPSHLVYKNIPCLR